MVSIEQAVVEKLRQLPSEQQHQVLEFLEFLEQRAKKQEQITQRWAGMTALEAAQSVMGVVGDGPPDLSTNPKYFDGFGQ